MQAVDRAFVLAVAHMEAADRNQVAWFDLMRVERRLRQASQRVAPISREEARDLVIVGLSLGDWLIDTKARRERRGL